MPSMEYIAAVSFISNTPVFSTRPTPHYTVVSSKELYSLAESELLTADILLYYLNQQNSDPK